MTTDKQTPSEELRPIEIRNNLDGALDEVVAHNCFFHLEQMDKNAWWMAAEQDGVRVAVWLRARGKIEAYVEKESVPVTTRADSQLAEQLEECRKFRQSLLDELCDHSIHETCRDEFIMSIVKDYVKRCHEADHLISTLISRNKELVGALKPFAEAELTPSKQIIGIMQEDVDRARTTYAKAAFSSSGGVR